VAAVPAGERFARQHRDTYYKVRRGDTLSTIARRYGVRVSDLVALNNLRSRHRIRSGQVLILPDDARGTAVRVARQEPPPDGVYRVRRGDNLTLIAARFGVSASELARNNGLRNRNVLYVGQTLRLPGHPVQVASVVPTPVPRAEPEPAPAPVRPEPSRSAAAEREDEVAPDVQTEVEAEIEAEVEEAAALPVEPEPEADDFEDVTPPPAPAPRPEPEAVAALDDGAMGPPSPDPSNYAVTADDRIVIQAEETLGHYAEWLEVRASDLRRLNHMRYETPLVIGRSLRLDLRRVPPEVFEQRRLAYHQALQEEFFSSYVVTGTRTHRLRSGESLWYLAERKFRVPVWLLRQYNPELDFGALPAGAKMVIPEVEPRTG
jgi:membrane-bound lytic murein transglycosylase D